MLKGLGRCGLELMDPTCGVAKSPFLPRRARLACSRGARGRYRRRGPGPLGSQAIKVYPYVLLAGRSEPCLLCTVLRKNVGVMLAVDWILCPGIAGTRRGRASRSFSSETSLLRLASQPSLSVGSLGPPSDGDGNTVKQLPREF